MSAMTIKDEISDDFLEDKAAEDPEAEEDGNASSDDEAVSFDEADPFGDKWEE